ncbi:hypothetical protein [Nostoc sp. C117]
MIAIAINLNPIIQLTDNQFYQQVRLWSKGIEEEAAIAAQVEFLDNHDRV